LHRILAWESVGRQNLSAMATVMTVIIIAGANMIMAIAVDIQENSNNIVTVIKMLVAANALIQTLRLGNVRGNVEVLNMLAMVIAMIVTTTVVVIMTKGIAVATVTNQRSISTANFASVSILMQKKLMDVLSMGVVSKFNIKVMVTVTIITITVGVIGMAGIAVETVESKIKRNIAVSANASTLILYSHRHHVKDSALIVNIGAMVIVMTEITIVVVSTMVEIVAARVVKVDSTNIVKVALVLIQKRPVNQSREQVAKAHVVLVVCTKAMAIVMMEIIIAVVNTTGAIVVVQAKKMVSLNIALHAIVLILKKSN